MKQLSIIIVNYNVVHFLELCLSSVFNAINELDAEVIVVDNASSDASCAMVKERFPEVVLIANQDNVGFATANNQGVAIAQGTYVCILNPDTVVGETVFNTMYAFAKANEKLGAIGARLIDGTGTFLPECKRNLPTPKVAFNKLFGKGNTYYARDIKPDARGKVQVLVGAFMFIAKEVYLEAGGFDEQYFMYGEDIDLSHTIAALGYENYYLGDQAVVHFKGESTAKDTLYRKRFFNAMHIFYKKHLKRNILEGSIVSLGLWFAQNVHRPRSIDSYSKGKLPKHFVVLSKNKTLIKDLEKALEIKMKQAVICSSVHADTEYLFDMELLSYQDCIGLMLTNSDKGATFKFIPKNSTFALGSNSSEGQGKRINLK